jgi:hypothetical protein
VTQPEYVPLIASDRVRPSARLSVPRGWRPVRPGEITDPAQPRGPKLGAPGPDLGYGLKLAKRFVDRLVLTGGEDAEDALVGCFACGAKRAAMFGRAPVIHDMRWAYTVWGFLGWAPAGLVELRKPLFRGASHHYWDQREIVDRVKDGAFLLTPDEVAEQLPDDWLALVG